jgi:hypothetical protein
LIGQVVIELPEHLLEASLVLCRHRGLIAEDGGVNRVVKSPRVLELRHGTAVRHWQREQAIDYHRRKRVGGGIEYRRDQ